jgi:two-component system sensor histidine kinase HydH
VNAHRLPKALVLLLSIAVISGLHYLTSPQHAILHSIYQRAYYVPIILAAYWYGVPGGLAAAVVSSIAYLPHIHEAWSHNAPYTASQYAELVVFLLLGFSVGFITSHERRLGARYRRAAESLEVANRDLRESQEHLRRAERLSALGEVAAGLAHEIRNPLAGVKGALEIVAGRVTPGSPEAEFAGVAARELAQLERLVDEFLAYARPRPPEFRPTRIVTVLEHLLTLLRPEAERAGVILDESMAPDLAPISVDPQQLQQVIFNVALNAVQATPRGGRVRIAVEAEGQTQVVQVDDEGPGIPAGLRSRIFEPFFTTKERGTGLGLAISHRIVTAHGGRLVFDDRPGGGALVRIVLPTATTRLTLTDAAGGPA